MLLEVLLKVHLKLLLKVLLELLREVLVLVFSEVILKWSLNYSRCSESSANSNNSLGTDRQASQPTDILTIRQAPNLESFY